MKEINRIRWSTLSLVLVVFVILSVGLAYLVQNFVARLHLPLNDFELLAYLIVFGIAVIVNLSFVPLPFLVSIMIVVAAKWNPLLVALCGSLGASLGEFSGYYVGLISKKLAIPDNLLGYKRIQRWIERYGLWAIAFLSFQPILPVEIGAFIAGTAKMPIHNFLPALWLGKFPKYLILIYLGNTLMHLVPFLQ